MKTIGLLGGMNWESSAEYYRLINQGIKTQLGGLHSAKLLMYSVDFEEIEKLQHSDDWERATQILVQAASCVQAGGADFLLICTNTMHKMYDEIAAALKIPVIHIGDATAEAVKRAGLNTAGVLGTKFTMEQDFYCGRLRNKHSLKVIVPEAQDRDIVHQVIYDELCKGIVSPTSKQAYLSDFDSCKGFSQANLG